MFIKCNQNIIPENKAFKSIHFTILYMAKSKRTFKLTMFASVLVSGL